MKAPVTVRQSRRTAACLCTAAMTLVAVPLFWYVPMASAERTKPVVTTPVKDPLLGERTAVDMTITLEGDSVSTNGALITSRGERLQGAMIVFKLDDREIGVTMTNENGEFQFKLPQDVMRDSNPHTLSATFPGDIRFKSSSASGEITGAGKAPTLDMHCAESAVSSGGILVTGSLKFGSKPGSGVHIYAGFSGNDRAGSAVTDSGGNFEVGVPAPAVNGPQQMQVNVVFDGEQGMQPVARSCIVKIQPKPTAPPTTPAPPPSTSAAPAPAEVAATPAQAAGKQPVDFSMPTMAIVLPVALTLLLALGALIWIGIVALRRPRPNQFEEPVRHLSDISHGDLRARQQ